LPKKRNKLVSTLNTLKRIIPSIDMSDFALSLGVWLVHSDQPGNLKRATQILEQTLIAGFKTIDAHEI